MPDDQEILWDELREVIRDGKQYMPRDSEGTYDDVDLRVVYRIDPSDSPLWKPPPSDSSQIRPTWRRSSD